MSSASEKPDCKARPALDLAVDFTILIPSPAQHLRKKFTQGHSNFSGQSTHEASANFGLERPKLAGEKVTCVSELLYRNIVSQPGTLAAKTSSNPMNQKQLFLFCLMLKDCICLRFLDKGQT